MLSRKRMLLMVMVLCVLSVLGSDYESTAPYTDYEESQESVVSVGMNNDSENKSYQDAITEMLTVKEGQLLEITNIVTKIHELTIKMFDDTQMGFVEQLKNGLFELAEAIDKDPKNFIIDAKEEEKGTCDEDRGPEHEKKMKEELIALLKEIEEMKPETDQEEYIAKSKEIGKRMECSFLNLLKTDDQKERYLKVKKTNLGLALYTDSMSKLEKLENIKADSLKTLKSYHQTEITVLTTRIGSHFIRLSIMIAGYEFKLQLAYMVLYNPLSVALQNIWEKLKETTTQIWENFTTFKYNENSTNKNFIKKAWDKVTFVAAEMTCGFLDDANLFNFSFWLTGNEFKNDEVANSDENVEDDSQDEKEFGELIEKIKVYVTNVRNYLPEIQALNKPDPNNAYSPCTLELIYQAFFANLKRKMRIFNDQANHTYSKNELEESTQKFANFMKVYQEDEFIKDEAFKFAGTLINKMKDVEEMKDLSKDTKKGMEEYIAYTLLSLLETDGLNLEDDKNAQAVEISKDNNDAIVPVDETNAEKTLIDVMDMVSDMHPIKLEEEQKKFQFQFLEGQKAMKEQIEEAVKTHPDQITDAMQKQFEEISNKSVEDLSKEVKDGLIQTYDQAP